MPTKNTKQFGLLFFFSVASLVLGFGNQLVVSFHFGTSHVLDSYWAMFAFANLLLFYVQPFREALIPPVHAAVAVDTERAYALFSSGLAFQAALAALSMSILVALKVFNVGVAESGSLFLYFLPFFVLYALSETCNGLLLSFNRVVHQAVARVISGIVGLLCLWMLAGHIGVVALVLSLLITQLVAMIVALVGLWRQGVRFVWRGWLPIWEEARFRSLFSSLLLGYLMAQGYVFVERATMVGMMPGLVSSYQYSVLMVNMLISLAVLPLANFLWPRFLDQALNESADAMLRTATRFAAPLSLTILAVCGFTERFAPSIVQVVFGRGSFDEVSTIQTSHSLKATICAALPISIFAIYGKMLLSQGRGRAMGAANVSIAICGSAVVLLAGWLDSVQLVRWHWAIGNAAGMLVVVFMVLRLVENPAQYVRAGLLWFIRACAIVLLALWMTPSVDTDGDMWTILTRLALSFLVFSGLTIVFAEVAQVSKLRARIWPGNQAAVN